MSEIKTDLAWVVPPFTARGRLSASALQVGQNCYQRKGAI